MDIKTITQKWSEVDETGNNPSMALKLSKREKRFLIAGFSFAFVVTVLYWMAGGRNLFVFPALLCIALIMKSFLVGKHARRGYQYFTRGTRTLAVRRNGSQPNKRR